MDILCYLRWIAYALLIASVIPAGLSVPQFIKSRRGAYYAIRQAALGRATRCLLVMAAMQVVAIILLIVCPYLEPAGGLPTPAPERTPAPVLTPTPISDHTPTAVPTPRPTATPTLTPSPTPTVPPPDGGPTPTLSPVAAGEDARIYFTALATARNESGLPVNPGDEFPPGDHAVYVFFTYEGMQNGVERTFAWYKDGEFFDRCSQTALWTWGDRGRTSYYCKPSTGWEPGEYEIHVFIEDRLQFVAEFVITAPP